MADLFTSPFACQCESCSPEHPGETFTEAFRHACEARAVAGMASDSERSSYLSLVRKVRGDDEENRLRRSAWKVMRG